MSYPPILELATDSPAVVALLENPITHVMRLWPFSIAPQKGKINYGVPYAVHQLIYGTPENSLSCRPDIDNYGIQIDVYGSNPTESRNVMEALREAFELAGTVTAINPEDWEQATSLYRTSFTVEFWTPRHAS